MIVLIGRSGSGKTTIVKHLQLMGYQRKITDTTRPIRDGEIDGVDYNFYSQADFDKLVSKGYYAETVNYHASFGFCSYGSKKDYYKSSDEKSVIILSPKGLCEIRKNVNGNDVNKYISIYLNVPLEVCTKRLFVRGDSEDEMRRRTISDALDFKGISEKCDFTLNVVEGDTVNDICSKIELLRKGGNKCD